MVVLEHTEQAIGYRLSRMEKREKTSLARQKSTMLMKYTRWLTEAAVDEARAAMHEWSCPMQRLCPLMKRSQ